MGEKWNLEDALGEGNWDYISLQGVTANGSYINDDLDVLKVEVAESAEPLLDRFHQRFPQAQLLWQRTWFFEIGRVASNGYVYTEEDGPKYNAGMQYVCDYMCNEFDKDKEYDLVMVNTGAAWTKARELNETANVLPYGGLCARLGKNSFGDGRGHSGDGYHDGDIGGGQLLNAYVWYMTITGDTDLSDSTYKPLYHANYPLSDEFVAVLKEAAESVFAK